MGIFYGLETSASALTSQRLVMDVISNNIANATTTRTPEGGPFKRQMAILMERSSEGGNSAGNGSKVVDIVQDAAPPRMVYLPGHPDANKDGYVAMPDIEIVKEMVDLTIASRSYQANVTAFNEGKQMILKALELGK
ncbi:MAG: flagellar basal body rod protein FlgC [Candidatus Eremiobacterota bacterium]